MDWQTSTAFVKGIGADRAKFIEAMLDISNVEDLLSHYPIRYVDKSKKILASEVVDGEDAYMEGRIFGLQEITSGKVKRLVAKFSDGTANIDLVWFNFSKWMMEQIPQNTLINIYGRVQSFNTSFSIVHPEIEKQGENQTAFRPIYSTSEKLSKRGLNQKFFQTAIRYCLENLPKFCQENLPHYLLESLRLSSKVKSLQDIHFPPSIEELEQAQRRIKFEEAFFLQLAYGLKKIQHQKSTKGHPMIKIGDFFLNFYNNILPFPLTNAQKRVLKEIRSDMKRSIQMNRLLQGDVGSGKTIVALMCGLIAVDNGFQVCIIAPTEILAQQHFQGMSDLLKGTDVRIELLTGSSKASYRRKLHPDLEKGDVHILVGTHAVLEEKVKFKNLGLSIIDEQHRFGVAQRAKLWAKNIIPPHILVMTATPIPRTLAMSFYGDLDVSIIDELPSGRKPIITVHKREKDRLNIYHFLKEEIEKGRQIYIVYPLIEESETLDYQNLMDGFSATKDYFPECEITMVHGKMTPEEKDTNMQYFASGKAQILVATTVIEVGVNVPNASVMVIESAERFGLSQLHQLRGRVGRGSEQSYCILMSSDKLSQDSRTRLKTMVDTTDGFIISEVDLKLRGPGNILGTQQSGSLNFKKLDIVKDQAIIQAARDVVNHILKVDPQLSDPRHQSTLTWYRQNYRTSTQWSKIS